MLDIYSLSIDNLLKILYYFKIFYLNYISSACNVFMLLDLGKFYLVLTQRIIIIINNISFLGHDIEPFNHIVM